MLTFVGVINSRADNTPSDSWQRKFAEEYSAFFIGTGIVSCGIGIPLLIIGISRTKTNTAQLIKCNETSCIPSIGIRITF
jgi:hypothetical protein